MIIFTRESILLLIKLSNPLFFFYFSLLSPIFSRLFYNISYSLHGLVHASLHTSNTRPWSLQFICISQYIYIFNSIFRVLSLKLLRLFAKVGKHYAFIYEITRFMGDIMRFIINYAYQEK